MGLFQPSCRAGGPCTLNGGRPVDKVGIKDLSLAGKRVLVRVDFNVPLDGSTIADDTRIRAALPTIQYILEQKGQVILMSHLGRPEGQSKPELSLIPVSERLAELLNRPVPMAPDCIGPDVVAAVDKLQDGDLLLLENLRFHPEEEENDPEFAKQLAARGDLYVNDAFGAAHRAHASTEGITHYLHPCAAGLLMEKEIQYLSWVLENPRHPFLAILGGAKVSDKIGVIINLLEKADELIIGGGMAYTFLKAKIREVGDSLVEDDKISLARDILKKSVDLGVPIYLPIDHVVTDTFAPDARSQIVLRNGITKGWQGMDIGPATVQKFSNVIRKAKTIVWNGPLGVFEFDRFAKGTSAIAAAIANTDAISIIGGGDCVAAVQKAGVADKMTHISTGGGASLEFLEGKQLPGVAALTDRK